MKEMHKIKIVKVKSLTACIKHHTKLIQHITVISHSMWVEAYL